MSEIIKKVFPNIEGPDVEYVNSNGDRYWYLHDRWHRLDGPAIEFADGTKFWYQYGLFHRLDGPAIEYVDGGKYWCYQGKSIDCHDQRSFEKLLKLKAFW
jgi:hypothetical protein